MPDDGGRCPPYKTRSIFCDGLGGGRCRWAAIVFYLGIVRERIENFERAGDHAIAGLEAALDQGVGRVAWADGHRRDYGFAVDQAIDDGGQRFGLVHLR